MAKSKPFEQSLHDDNDLPARKVVQEFYARIGVALIDNPDRYGIDLVETDGPFCVEVERRPVWDKDAFPFVEVNFLERKVKFFRDRLPGSTTYAIVSKDLKGIGIIDDEGIMAVVEKSAPKENPNRFVHDSEFFYKIPRSSFVWFRL